MLGATQQKYEYSRRPEQIKIHWLDHLPLKNYNQSPSLALSVLFGMDLTPGRGLASRLSHVGLYLTESDISREDTKTNRKDEEFSAPYFIFQLHFLNGLLSMVSGFSLLLCNTSVR